MPARPAPKTAVRRDPAPSRLAYRLNRMMLRPLIRRLVRIGLPAFMAALVAGIWLSDETRRAHLSAGIDGIVDRIQNREAFLVHSMEIEGASPAVEKGLRAMLPVTLPASSFDIDLPNGERYRESATVRPGDEDGRVRIEWRAPLTPPPATVPLAMKEAMRHLRERYGNPASGFSALEGAGLGPQGLRLFRGRSDDGKGTLTADQFHDHHFGGHALVAPSVPAGDSQAEVVARLLARARARQDADPRQKVRLRLVRVARGQWSGCWEGHDPDGGALNVTGSLEDVLRGLLDDPDAPGAER